MNDDPQRERLELLYAMEAVGGLSDAEAAELEELRSLYPDIDGTSFQLAAAAMDLAFATEGQSTTTERLPDALRNSILTDAQDVHSWQRNGAAKSAATKSVATERVQAEVGVDHATDESFASAVGPSARSGTSLNWLGWICALAASIALVIVSIPQGDEQANSAPTSAESLRLALLERSDTQLVQWTQGPTPFSDTVTGNVAWNQRDQRGFMLFEGMPINDPTVEQYQLWIIDPKRDQHPIDGGVFDVSDPKRAVVAIDAKLKVVDPQAFAITIEKPGGVVVSDQSRLPLLASVPQP